MKCIIADDEHLVRFSIQDMLEEIAESSSVWFEGILQVADGKDLVQQVRLHQPDVVFVDIRMPLVNGLDAMEQGKRISPATQWIILTGYAEFDYAKRAVALGALDYLLKPASREDIERVVQLALSHMKDRRALEQVFLEHRMQGLLQDTFSEESEGGSDKLLYTACVGVLDSPMNLQDTYLAQHRLMLDLRAWLRTTPQISSTSGLVPLDDGGMAFALASSSHSILLQERQLATDYLYNCLLEDESARGLAVTVVPLPSCESSLTHLLHELDQLSSEAYLRLAGSLGGFMDQGQQQKLKATFLQDLSFLQALDKHVRDRELEPVPAVQWVGQNRVAFERLWDSSGLARYFEVISGGYLTGMSGHRAVEAVMAWILKDHSECIASENPGRRLVVDKALSILHTHYTKEIGLAQVADMLGITPNYLSSEFNRIMGESFPHYMTRLRMEKAHELLHEGKRTVKEVSALVGYMSSRHFGKVFKKHFGHVPSEHPVAH
jgi:two-component system response regulator YesN